MNGHWHHICTTWSSLYGKWSVMYDGVAKSCSGLGTDQQLSHDVMIDLGNGKPSTVKQGKSSFRGQIASVYVWTEILSLTNMLSMFARCQPAQNEIKPTPIVTWEDFFDNATQNNSSIRVTRPSRCHARGKTTQAIIISIAIVR